MRPDQKSESKMAILRGIGRHVTWLGFLSELMTAFLIFAALAIPVGYLPVEWNAPIWVVLAAGWLLLWALRLYVRRIWQFVLPALVLVLAPLVLPGWLGIKWPDYLGILMALGLLGLAVRAFAQRLKATRDQIQMALSSQLFALAFLLGLDLLASYLKLPGLVMVYFYLAIAYILLAIVRWHSQALAESLARFMETPTQPAARIARFNRFLLFVFAGIMLLFLLLSPWLRLHELVPWLVRQLLNGLRWLVALLMSLFSSKPAETGSTEPAPIPTEPTQPLEPGQTPPWLMILDTIIYYLMQVFTLLIGVAALILLLVWIYRRFYASRQSGPDILESLLPNLKDEIRTRVARTSDRLQNRFGLEPELRIRRLYSHLIPRLGRQNQSRIDNTLTARQIASLLDQNQPDILQEVTRIYEKARYGNKSCTGDDVRRMQLLSRECLTTARNR